MSILLVRHAESEFHGRFCGSSDPPLSATGQKQARQLAASLHGRVMDRIYASPLCRALQTAQAFAGSTPVVVLNDLQEIDFGQWEGLTWNEIELRDPAYAKRWVEEFPHLPAPGGELPESFRQRVEAVFARIQSEKGSGTAAIVAHSGVLGAILAHTTGESFQSVRSLENAEVYEIG